MRTRMYLQDALEKITGKKNVFYQPPSKLDYPCIIFDKTSYDTKHADDIKYLNMTRYQIMVIGKKVDNDKLIDKILQLDYCSFDRRYISENLYHDTFTIYI